MTNSDILQKSGNIRGLPGKFLIPYVGCFLFALWTYNTVSRLTELESIKSNLLRFQSLVFQAQTQRQAFLSEGFKGSEFLPKGDSPELNEHNLIMERLAAISLQLQDASIIHKANYDSIQLLKTQYENRFLKLVQLTREKGFKDHGLIGQLRNTIHEVEEVDIDYDRSLLLMLRRHEKDFFLSYDLIYKDKFRQAIFDFKDHIQRIYATEERKNLLVKRLSDYQSAFEKTVSIQARIGLTDQDGLKGEISGIVQVLVFQLEGLISKSIEEANDRIRLNIFLLVILLLAITGIGIFLLTFRINRFGRSINLMQHNVMMLAAGSFPKTNGVKSRDELYLAHQAIGELTESLRQKSRFAESLIRGELDAELEILSERDHLGFSLIELRDNLVDIATEASMALNEVGIDGKLATKVDTQGKSGTWRDLAESTNSLLSSVEERVSSLIEIADAMAHGDLTNTYTTESNGDISALARQLNLALASINELLTKIKSSATQIEGFSQEMLASGAEINMSTKEVATTISQMGVGAENQVATADVASSNFEKVLESAKSMNEKSSSITIAAKKGVGKAKEGVTLVGDVRKSIGIISRYSEYTKASMDTLGKRSSEIVEFLSVIQDIAGQTNLLALNAAIEAAQAGDAGRGFAVVAEEIRKLAENSKKSTTEIEKLVGAIQNDTQVAQEAAEQTHTGVKQGKAVTAALEKVFSEIVNSSEETFDDSMEILDQAQHQQKDIETLVSVMERVVVFAAQTAAGTKEVAGATEEIAGGMELYMRKVQEMADVVRTLRDELSNFKLRETQDYAAPPA